MTLVASVAGTVVALVILAWLIGGAACGMYLFVCWLREHRVGIGRWQMSEEEKAHRSELRAHNKEVRSIERAHQRAVGQARAALGKAEKAQRKRVSILEKELARAREPEKLDGFWSTKGWAKLYEDRVETSKGTIPLTPGVLADVNTSGNLAIGGRSTLTRMGTGAIVAGPLGFMVGMAAKKDRKVDTRELYLIVQSESGGGVVVACSPDQGEKVRQFALNLMGAARLAPQASEARRQAITSAQRRALQRGESKHPQRGLRTARPGERPGRQACAAASSRAAAGPSSLEPAGIRRRPLGASAWSKVIGVCHPSELRPGKPDSRGRLPGVRDHSVVPSRPSPR